MRRTLALALAILAIAACGGQTDHDKAEAALQRGLELQTQGRLQSAAQQYETALIYEPRNKLAYYNLGLVWQQLGQNQDAEMDYRQSLAIDPAYAPALYNLALLRTGPAPEEAVQLYRRELAVRPNDAAGHYNLGLLLRSLGQTLAGDAEIAAALRLNPELGRSPSPAPSPSPSPG